MSQEEILRKLNNVLNEDIKNEYQVVYIFSRIRKFLELKGLQSKYKNLNFYCNWALHSKIDRTEPVSEILRKFIKNKNKKELLYFRDLHKSLYVFLSDFNLPKKIITYQKNYTKFMHILVEIYSDTPLVVYPEEKVTITLTKTKRKLKNSEFSINYSIE